MRARERGCVLELRGPRFDSGRVHHAKRQVRRKEQPCCPERWRNRDVSHRSTAR